MTLSGDEARELSRHLIDKYFRTITYPYTRHHLDSFDQFLRQDLTSIIKANNPILILKDLINPDRNIYKYKVEIYVGGEDAQQIEIGTPTVSLQNTEEVRVLYPNEARLRNLTYASTVYADIIVKITYTSATGQTINLDVPRETFQKWPLFKIPIMLHSRYCILHNKPKNFLIETGECPYDNGGYFIVDGAEKVLITRQEQAFNTLYVTPQESDPKIAVYASITCLSSETRQVKRVAFALMRRSEKENYTSHETIQVTIPFVRKAIPLFVLFRALGFQSDEEILRMIFPDFESPEAKLLLPKLQPSIIEAYPFLNSYTAIRYIKTLTKGFSEAHVLDIIKNQLFIHMPNDPSSQALFLGDCVRKILRVSEGYDTKTDRDDTRNQRCLTSGFLTQMLFSAAYKTWKSAVSLAIDKEYNYNKAVLYKDENFKNIFQPGNDTIIFVPGLLSEQIMRGFKGKWGTGMGEEKSGVLQALSRLSYTDFMSHCRRVILDFDTGMKLTGPRKLHTSQYGYFCTSETPTGASIGITKNLSIMTAISTASDSQKIKQWLRTTGRVYAPEDVSEDQRIVFVPFYLNGGMFGYTAKPHLLTKVLKTLKRCGCLPYSVSISFSIHDRCVYFYIDEGRPLRPLIWLDQTKNNPIQIEKLSKYPTWRDLVMGNLLTRQLASLDSTDFFDPLAEKQSQLEDYPEALAPYTGAIEYVDPYEQNEAFIANNPAYIKKESTHMEVHPSTIMGLMTSLIPFAPHNQSPRNQLSCSQSKQGLSIYATNWRNRFDNTAHVLCYGEMPISRTIYNNYLGEGKMAYGMNCVLAIATWSGYNQEDGIVMNYDAIQRGMFRSMAFRSYEAFEEDDEVAKIKVRFGNPSRIANWKDLKPGLDYSKLDERGIIREGEFVDENTVLVGAYMAGQSANVSDASVTPQVWTRGRVEKVFMMVNNMGLRLVKIRVVQDRMPELGDKFSNRHGQKGTIGALLRGHDMPRTKNGLVPDMIMNPHAIPSRMTIAQNLEQLLGKTAALSGGIGDGTSFMNDGSPEEAIGSLLDKHGYERYGNEVLYNGATGEQIQAAIFIGPVYGMRLKHMVEDKWQARGKGRKEQRTHQPTGGRGNQGGLKIGEMDRDAILGHGISGFFKESFMERSDGAKFPICTSCGTIPIYNPRLNINICSLCDGPVRFIGDSDKNLEILPPLGRPKSKVVEVEIPFSTKLLSQELETYLNMGLRFMTTSGFQKLRELEYSGKTTEAVKELPRLILPEIVAPAYIEEAEKATITVEQLESMGVDLTRMSEAERAEIDQIMEESPEGQLVEQQIQIQQPQQLQNEIINPEQGLLNQGLDALESGFQQGVSFIQQIPQQFTGEQQQTQIQQQPQPTFNPFNNNTNTFTGNMSGGLMPPNDPMMISPGNTIQSALPGAGPTLVIDTSPQAMMQDGIEMPMMNRPIRRNSYGRMNYGNNMSASMGAPRMRQNYMANDIGEGNNSGFSSNSTVTVNKLE